ncbi:porin family protein [Flavobacterium undicola]|uniref:porin family protein n=1 Tax=Flavobacterium undicola TaxID=1932779 RepID=UPI0013779295|nr:porin family protein [Flavobacterium undicola]MBA0883503.1 PorT family protein [Flavobacterium undicola]
MRKTYLMMLFFGIITSISAQENTSHESHGGIKGGYNLASVSFDGNYGETDQRHGFHIGVYGESFIDRNFSVQPELLFSQQGYEITDNTGRFIQKLNYINVPVMFKAYPSNNLFLEIGPQIGWAITHKEIYDGYYSSTTEYDPDSIDWGMNFGAGIKTNSGINLGVRYHLGLGDLYDAQKAQNRVWMFSLGFDL